MQSKLTDAIVELYRKAATELPSDITKAIIKAKKSESGIARHILDIIIKNIQLSKKKSSPLCQDTGTPIFLVNYPSNRSTIPIRKSIEEATRIATQEIPLRPNAVDILSGKNLNKNIPGIHFNEWPLNYTKIQLMLKGGGSENVGRIYKLPDMKLDAGRDLAGIKKCVIDAVIKAQGNGCAPGIIGIGIGGLTDTAIKLSKMQFFRKLDDSNPKFRKLEKSLYKQLNNLNIGPMGLGGKTTVLGVKFAAIPRHPASFFVAVSYMCWACRRKTLIFKNDKAKYTS